jgi:hypothetical protein
MKEIIREVQVIQLPDAKLWVNPSHWELTELVKKHDLRGWAGPSKLIVWSGNASQQHDFVLDDLIEMGEVGPAFAETAAKCLIADTGSDFSSFDYWEKSDETVLHGQGMDVLFNTDTGVKMDMITRYKPVCRALKLQNQQSYHSHEDLMRQRQQDAEKSLAGMLANQGPNG